MLFLFNTFTSIQGESIYAGLPCFFIRLAGCPLRCSYCDTRAACETRGTPIEVPRLVKEFISSGMHRVEVTGGEPLAQEDSFELLESLCNTGAQVLLETSGSVSVSRVDPRVHVVLDVKCPDSGMAASLYEDNLDLLRNRPHELKFVVCSRSDFEWVVNFVTNRDLHRRSLLLSPVSGLVSSAEAAEWILVSGMDFRLQMQLHKWIWPQGGDNR